MSLIRGNFSSITVSDLVVYRTRTSIIGGQTSLVWFCTSVQFTPCSRTICRNSVLLCTCTPSSQYGSSRMAADHFRATLSHSKGRRLVIYESSAPKGLQPFFGIRPSFSTCENIIQWDIIEWLKFWKLSPRSNSHQRFFSKVTFWKSPCRCWWPCIFSTYLLSGI